MTDVNLPAVVGNTLPVLDQLTTSLGVPRDILASDQEIQTAWNNLPGVMNNKISRDIHLKERPLHFFVIDFAVRLCFHFK